MHLRFSIAADFETELVRDLNLSTQGRTMAKVPVYLYSGTREFTLPQSGLEDPVYVTSTSEGADDSIPTPVEIGNISNLDSDAYDGRRVVAFFSDKPQRGMVSWMPSGAETLSIWYDRSPSTDPGPDQSTFSITDSYVPLLKLLLAGQMLELMGKPLGEMLKNRIARGLKQWEKFAKNGKQQGTVKKSTFRPGRFQGGNIWSAWPGRIPFE